MEPRDVHERFMATRAKSSKDSSLVRTLFKTFRSQILWVLLITNIFTAVAVIGPVVFLRKLIQYAGEDESDLQKGLLLVLGLFVFDVLRSMTVHQFWFTSMSVAVNLRSVTYSKSLSALCHLLTRTSACVQ